MTNLEISRHITGQGAKAHSGLRCKVGLSGLMCTTALIVVGTSGFAETLPSWDTEPYFVTVPSSSDISQIDGAGDATNSLSINSTGTLAIVNGVTKSGTVSAVQDAALGSNTLNITTDSAAGDNPNYIFVSQLGDVTQTLTITGAGNKVYLVDFGGTADSINDEIVLNGNDNIMTLETSAFMSAHTLLGVDIYGDSHTIYVSNDEFSKLTLYLNGFADDVSVVQDNSGVTEQYTASMTLFNEADVSIIASNFGNVVSIAQTGTNNVLDFDLQGDGNNITVNQVNSGVGLNDLTVDLSDDDVDLTINASGAGVNAFTVAGTGNVLTIKSDPNADGLSSANAEANVTVLGNQNILDSQNYTDVAVTLGAYGATVTGNTVTTSGNVEVGIFSDDNTVTFYNDDGNDSFIPYIFIGEGENGLTDNDGNTINATNTDMFDLQTDFKLYISGNGNGYDLDTWDLSSAYVEIVGNSNDVIGSNGVINSVFELVLIGNDNDVNFDNLYSIDNNAQLGIEVLGNLNNLTLASTAAEVYSSNFRVEGNRNTFSYDLLAGVVHTTVGSDFGATFTATSTSGGRSYYNLSMDAFGTGFTKFTTGASSMVITGDCSYSEDSNGVGACS